MQDSLFDGILPRKVAFTSTYMIMKSYGCNIQTPSWEGLLFLAWSVMQLLFARDHDNHADCGYIWWYVQVFFPIHIDWLWWIESFIKWHSRSWPFTVRWGIACFESSRFAKASCSVESWAGNWIQKMTSTPGLQIRSTTGVDVTILVRMWIVFLFSLIGASKGKVWWHVDFIDLKANSHGTSQDYIYYT